MKHKNNVKKVLIKSQENTEKVLIKHEEKTEKQPFKCSVCGKEFKKKAGLGGHMWGIHSIKMGRKEELKQLKSKLELTLKELDSKKDCFLKEKIYACPKCNAGIRGWDFKMVS